MIRAAAVCPSAPMLLPEYVGQDDVAADLRAACRGVVESVCRTAERVVLVTADVPSRHTSQPPLGERVGRSLLDGAGVAPTALEVLVVSEDATVTDCAAMAEQLADAAVIVVGDGSARRSEKAPGHLDERSFAFDAAIVQGLGGQAGLHPDPFALLGLDPQLARELLARGRAPLQVLAAALGDGTAYRTARCDVTDPFGVLYVVAEIQPAAS